MPLHAARALPPIISHISPYFNAPQIVVAALRALTDIADAAILAPSSSSLAIETIAEQIFSPQNLESLNAILSISSSKHLAQSQVTLASGLIPKLCREEKQRNALITAGVLDSLAARLASFAVSEGFVVPGANLVAERNGLADVFPEPAPNNAKLGPILDAITTIIGDSKYRANRLVLSPAILAVFPSIRIDPLSGIIDPRFELDYGLVGDSRCMDLTAMDFVLPAVPLTLSRHSSCSASHSSHTTPDLSDSQTRSRDSNSQKTQSSIWGHAFKSSLESEAESEDVECPIIPWLVHLVRSRSSYERLMAASVLASLYKAGLGSKSLRETSLGLLVVPILVEMIAQNSNGAVDPTKPGHLMRRVVLERAPFVLARLIIDCDNLQKAAFDSQAVPALTKLLRRSFTPVELSDQPQLWSPHPNMDIDSDDSPPALRLGERGVDAELAHRIKVREASLQAIAALAAGKEEYRKSFMSEDLFMGFVAQSLTLFPRKPTLPSKDRSKDEKANESAPNTAVSGYGTNPLSVIIAGCHVIRMLSRSVSIMRTAIVDYGVYLPVLQFAKHPDVDVQTAATATLANMVLEVSPVREVSTLVQRTTTSNSTDS
jgi:armadillo repeat-containing protein 8